MKRDDLPTVGYLDECFRAVLSHLQAGASPLTAAGPATTATPRLLSIEDVMQECSVSRSTVQRWIKSGKPGRQGSTITLQVYYFAPSEPRVPWPALAAFGQGLAFDLSSLNLGAVPPPPPAAAATPAARAR